MNSVANIRKPAAVPSLTIVCRPRQAMTGGFLVNLSVQALSGFSPFPGKSPFRPAASLIWCGSRSLIGFGSGASSYSTMLRLPTQVHEDDEYTITLRWDDALSVSATLFANDEAKAAAFELHPLEGAPFPTYVCADPSAAADRAWRDPIAAGACPVPARQTAPLWAVETLRRLPDSANLGLRLRRAGGAIESTPLQVTAIVGGMRRLGIIPANLAETAIEFSLSPEEPGYRWPLLFHSQSDIEWSASIYRGFDSNFLPAFTLADF